MPKFIRVFARLLRTRLKTAAKCARCGTGARDLDGRNLLMKEFAIPPGIGSGSAEDHLIRSEEGWILGCSG
jgi:hypothetical protein